MDDGGIVWLALDAEEREVLILVVVDDGGIESSKHYL